MINELLFLFHTLIIIISALLALKLGKSSLITFICLQSILSNLLVTKQITLFNLDVTSSDVFAVGALIGLNLLQEFFGREEAQKSILISFSALFFYMGMTQIHLLYVPNSFDTAHPAFHTIFALMPRLALSSLATYTIVQLIDLRLYGLLNRLCAGKYFVLRSTCSLLISQLLDTILFSYLALYGVMSSLMDVIIVAYLIKVIIIALSAPLLSFTKKYLRKTYDH